VIFTPLTPSVKVMPQAGIGARQRQIAKQRLRAGIVDGVSVPAGPSLPMDGSGKPHLIWTDPFKKDEIHLSPDGRWEAYDSGERTAGPPGSRMSRSGNASS